MMKKFILSVAIAAISQLAIAQGGNLVISAYNDYKNQFPDKAKASIDKAILDKDAAAEAKTWHYRGNIYLQVNSVAHMTDGLHKGMKSSEIKQRFGEPQSIRNYKQLTNGSKWSYAFDLVLYMAGEELDSWDFPNEALYKSLDDGKSLEEAYNSYQKSLKIDPKFMNTSINPMDALTGLNAVAGSFYNAGVNAYGEEKYKEAQYNLEFALKVYTDLGQSNPELTYYTGVACFAAGDTVKAMDYYNKAVKLQFKDKMLYINLTNLYLHQNQTDAAKKTIKAGRKIHPNEQNLLIAEANIYLKTGEANQAEAILLEAIKNDPDNADLYYVVGVNYDNIMNDTANSKEIKEHAFAQAQNSYIKALEINPNYFEANFNMGVLLNNKAAELLVEAGNIPIDQEALYNKLKDEAISYLSKAEPYLSKAHSINPQDKDCLVLLKQIYLKTNNTDKFKEIDAKLKAL